MNLEEIEKEIFAIQERNKKVEVDKAWETSMTRKVALSTLTYLAVVILLLVANVSNPYMSALIPTSGFLLSTLSLPWFKKKWIESRNRK